MFQLSYGNTSGGLGEWEMLAAGKCFHSFFKFFQIFTSVVFSVFARLRFLLRDSR